MSSKVLILLNVLRYFHSLVEDYCILYERKSGQRISRSIGGRAAFTDWFGNDIAQASEGKVLSQMHTGTDLENEVMLLLDGVYTRGGLHFSEVSCNLTGVEPGKRTPLLYQRLLAELVDRTGQPVVASIIQIIGLHQTDPMPG